MVNNKVSSKYVILSLLRQRLGDVLSGQFLADELGVSRVAVWKAIQSLQEAGYGIASRGKGPSAGYVLEEDLSDSLYPWEFGSMYKEFKHFKTTVSTMDEARVQAVQNTSVSIITADKQTNGRGRFDHKWVTTENGLSFTLVTRPVVSVGYYNRSSALSQIALVRVFEKFSARKFFVRWPNDVWSEEGKVAGILTDVQGTGDILSWVNVGIGINLSLKPSVAKSDSVFKTRSHKIPTRKEMLLEFLQEFKTLSGDCNKDPSLISRLWNSHCIDIGKNMGVKGKSGSYVFNGINNWAWALCDNMVFPPGEMRFIK